MAQRQAHKQQHMDERATFSAHISSVLQAVKAEQVSPCRSASDKLPWMSCYLLDSQVTAVTAQFSAQVCIREHIKWPHSHLTVSTLRMPCQQEKKDALQKTVNAAHAAFLRHQIETKKAQRQAELSQGGR